MNRSIRFILQPLWFAAAALMAASGHADSYTWNGLSNPFFNNTAAWTPNGTPSANDTANFGPSSTYNAFFDTSPTIKDLNILAGNVTFASFINPPIGFGPQTLIVSNTSLPNANGNSSLTLGGSGLVPLTLYTSALSLQNGATLTIQSGSRLLALSCESLNGSLNVEGSKIQLGSAKGVPTYIGLSGSNGFLTVENGGTAAIYGLFFLATDGSSSTATLSINGANSAVTLSSEFTPAFVVGSTTNGSAAVNIGTSDSGGTLTTDSNEMTIYKTGTVNVGSASTTGTLNANGNVVINGGALKVGAGSQFNLAAGKTLTINGGTADFKSYTPNASQLNFEAGSLSYAGNLSVGTGGLLGANLTLDSTRQLSLTGTTNVDATRTLVLSGGALHSAALVNNGYMDLTDGALTAVTAMLVTGSTLEIDLGGTTRDAQYGALVASGSVSLTGLLLVTDGSFSPAVGNSFDILDWGTRTGTFSSVQLPMLVAGRVWDTSQLYTTGVISVVATAGGPGDYNNNGVVDAADYVVWRDNKGTTTGLANDPIGGTIGSAQYNQWRSHFGQSAGSGSDVSSNASVPEPASALLLLILGAATRIGRGSRVAPRVPSIRCA